MTEFSQECVVSVYSDAGHTEAVTEIPLTDMGIFTNGMFEPSSDGVIVQIAKEQMRATLGDRAEGFRYEVRREAVPRQGG